MTCNNWYSLDKVLTYNALFNLIVGPRSIGKTFALKSYLLKKFLKKGTQFIYLRRKDSEVKELDKESFFNMDLFNDVFENYNLISQETTSRGYTSFIFSCTNYLPPKGKKYHEMKIFSNKVILNGKIVCYMKSISTYLKMKGSEYDNVYDILYDEALIDYSEDNRATRQDYLHDELEKLFKIMSSVFRNRKNCHVYLLGNPSTPNNPYMNYFELYDIPKKEYTFLKEYSALIQFAKTNPLDNNESNPYFKLIKKSKIYDSTVSNTYIENTFSNIQKLKGDKLFLYNLFCDGVNLGVFICNNLIYISNSYNKDLISYTFNKNDIESGYVYLTSRDSISKHLRKNYYYNKIIYENSNVKFKFNRCICNIL